MKFIIKIKILIFLLCITSYAKSGDALLRGVITDIKTKEPLGGVNVMLKGTYYGAATNSNGEFVISDVSPGSYDVSVQMIGYTVKLFSGIELKKNERKKDGVLKRKKQHRWIPDKM